MSNENKQNVPIVVVRDGQSNSGGVTGRSSFIHSDRLNGEPIYQMSWGYKGQSNIPVPPEGQFYSMEFPTQMLGMSNVTGCSFTMNFCKKLSKANPGRPIYVIACDVPGTGYNTSNQHYTWGHDGFNSYAEIPDSTGNRYLTKRMVDTIKKYSPTGSVDYIVGIQGENDAQNPNYRYQVLERLDYLRSLFGNFVFAMGTMLPSWLSLGANMGTPALSDSTHRSLAHIANNATTSFHDHIYGAFDGVHYDMESQRLIGIEFFNNIHRNIHAYQDSRYTSLFGGDLIDSMNNMDISEEKTSETSNSSTLFWYDMNRQNSNYGYMMPESKAFWNRTNGEWNSNTTGVKVGSHDCLWTSNDHLNTGVTASGLTHYTKIAMFTPTTLNSTKFGNIMSGSINSVLWVNNGTIAAMIGGHTYSVPHEQLKLQVGSKYLVVLSVSPEQVIFKVHDFANPNRKISATFPAKSHTFTVADNAVPIHVGNIPKTNDTNDGSEWYGFYGEIHFASMLSRNLNDWDSQQAVNFFSTYWDTN